jgi:DNA-binding transcriptional LysR family regulator
MDDLGNMRVFLAVARLGSFSEAGRQLDLAPSSISRQISQLEDSLGVRLFTRTTRSLTLTGAGEMWAERAARILLELEEAREAVRDFDAAPKGVVRVSAPIAFGRLHAAPAIIDFLQSYPDISVEYGLTDRNVDLIEEGMDVALRIGRLPDSSLIARRLAPMARVICASPRYLERRGVPTSPADLANHDCLTFRLYDAGSIWRPGADLWSLHGPDGVFELPVKGPLKASSAEVLVRAALADLGLILVLDWLVEPFMRTGELVHVLGDYRIADDMGDGAIYAVYPSGRYVPAKVRVFIDYMAAHFAKVPHDEHLA